MPSDILRKRKIAVLGSRSVGKSSLVIQFIESHFVESYYPTIETTHTKSINYRGVEYDCDIIDTAGQVCLRCLFFNVGDTVFQDEYTILNPKHAIGIHGYVLVYSVASRKSFNMVNLVYDKIVDFCGLNTIPCVIVGAKTDLPKASRQVEESEGQRLADEHHAAFVETSAKNNQNVAEVFQLCLGEIERQSPNHHDEPPASKCIIM
ncbi:P-loop containing nucleoside triphosphate hydrolase protein [Sparassis latifolia]